MGILLTGYPMNTKNFQNESDFGLKPEGKSSSPPCKVWPFNTVSHTDCQLQSLDRDGNANADFFLTLKSILPAFFSFPTQSEKTGKETLRFGYACGLDMK